jgi:UDP-glucose 4-epimerase
MNILITGGAGFIGSNLADRLIARGDKVSIIDDLTTGRLANIIDNLTTDKLESFFKRSICSIEDDFLRNVFVLSNPDVVIHAAASYKNPNDWVCDALVNTMGTACVADMCREYEVKRLIYFQTSLCYGQNPIEKPITLNHPINPANNSYAITKTAGERLIKMSGVDYISFRLANCYGPRNLSGPIPTFYHRLTNGKGCFVVNTRRDFIFIDDLLKIVMKAIDGCGEKGEYHIATGRDYSIAELFEAVTEALEIDSEADHIERGPDDVETILLDPSKTIRDFGIEANTPLQEGVEKAIEWYKANEIKETYTHLRTK